MSMGSRVAFVARNAMRMPRAVVPVRRMGGHGSPEEIYQSKEMWFKTSIAAIVGIVVPYTLVTVYKELQHEHHEKAQFAHMKIRHKAFPWKESDCDLFDMHCKHAAHSH